MSALVRRQPRESMRKTGRRRLPHHVQLPRGLTLELDCETQRRRLLSRLVENAFRHVNTNPDLSAKCGQFESTTPGPDARSRTRLPGWRRARQYHPVTDCASSLHGFAASNSS